MSIGAADGTGLTSGVHMAARNPAGNGTGGPDPRRIVTRQDFAAQLTLLREAAGLTVRQVARASGIPDASAGDYFAGRHLPPPRPDRLPALLRACGVTGAEAESWLDALRRVRRTPGRRPAVVPYRGLARFEAEDAGWYFGREALTATLVERVRGLGGKGALVVVGPSGAGKSSLIRAGLIPALREEAGAVLHTAGEIDAGALASLRARAPAVLAVDQFEEILADRAGAGEEDLIAGLLELPATVVLALRADFYGRALRHPGLAEVLQTGQVLVTPMNEDELRRAIVMPAQRAGLELEPGLVDLLLREVSPAPGAAPGAAHDAGTLPLLSHALLSTWERRRHGMLTIADYRDSGGIQGAVAATAEEAYRDLGETERQIARRLFLRLVHLTGDTGVTRRRVAERELGDGTSAVLARFVDQRLVTARADGVEIVHEALLAAWPRLRAWVETDRAGLRAHRRLTAAAEAWEESGRDPGTLLRGVWLAESEELAADPRRGAGLNELEIRFLRESVRRREAEARALRRLVRRGRRLIAVLSVVSLLALGLAAVTVSQRRAADEQRDEAVSRQVAVESGKLRGKDVALAAQTALAAYRVSPTPEARSALLESYAGPAVTRIAGPRGVLQSVAVSADGRTLATGGADRAVRLWNIAERGRPAPIGEPLSGHRDTVYGVAISPDGRTVADGGGGGTVMLRRIGGASRALTGPRSTVYAVAFGPDGRTLVAASADGTVRSWDPARPEAGGRILLEGGAAAHTAAFGPDGTTLAAGFEDGTVRLVDMVRREPAGEPLNAGSKTVFAVAFSPDGRTLAAGNADGNVRLWRVSGARAVPSGEPLTGPKGWVNGVAFAPDGRSLAAASSDGRVWVWDLAGGGPRTSLPHPGPVTAVAFLPSGALATAAADGTARIWDLPGPVVQGPGAGIFAAGLSRDGRVLALASQDGTARLWSVADPRRPAPLGPVIRHAAGDGRASGAAALSPDAGTLAIGGAGGPTQLWDVRSPGRPAAIPARLTGPAGLVQGLTFSPDGRLLAVASNDATVWLWDVRDPRGPARLAVLAGATNYAYQAAFSPDGRTLAYGTADNEVLLWDVSDPRHPARLGGPLTEHENYVFTVVFSPDGRTMATAGADNTVILWDLADRSRPRPLPRRLRGPTNYIYSLAHGPGGVLAAAAGDGTVWLWDVSEPSRPSAPATLTGSAEALYFDVADSRRPLLVTTGVGREVRLWDMDPERVAAQICAVAGTPVTEAEWRRHLPSKPYDPPC
ncbi:helix-turn-helix domain-containing protein [Actinomadura madurae]|uniref:nSTAND1 domain-containing NTPase n=1 Tax=Actinomadura madurae TaxID=1993 RepID=UPI002025EDCF|nr:helix-turn-helix domain-containing protein [Actinomadura madurae]URM93103.1 helix-turn-helix domain-containing protein [Actinomadura madurae]